MVPAHRTLFYIVEGFSSSSTLLGLSIPNSGACNGYTDR